MKRTKLKDRSLPVYTKGEELFNMITHIVGGAIGVAALVLCIVFSAVRGNGYGLAGSIVYGVSMIVLYTMSSVYHGLREGTAKRVMQVLDHCTIYLLIAGTYTPILLSAMRPIDPVSSWVLLGVVWGLSAIAITLTAIDLKKYSVFSMICYIGMGWCIVFKLPLLIEAVGWGGFWLILLGGVCYTVGAVLYGLGRTKKYMHSIFHLFVVAGSVLHLLAILIYAL
ncbi:MAG: hemolysin III family protein [Clostridia bacterium]|nr:hemolysin III family protein [Clostridia bacterium]MBQ6859446.1 hemolysin III family protein [Clostridia bacterium]